MLNSLDYLCELNSPSVFLFRARGSAMIPLILPGDILIVDRSIRVQANHIVLADLEEKRICRRLGAKDTLLAENKRFSGINFAQTEFFGVVKWCLRKF